MIATKIVWTMLANNCQQSEYLADRNCRICNLVYMVTFEDRISISEYILLVYTGWLRGGVETIEYIVFTIYLCLIHPMKNAYLTGPQSWKLMSIYLNFLKRDSVPLEIEI